MSNPIKVSANSVDEPALKIDSSLSGLNIYIGANDYPYGPSDDSGFYAGVTPEPNKYIVYFPSGEGSFLIYGPSDDEQLRLTIKQLFPTEWNNYNMDTNYTLDKLFIYFHQYIFNRDCENIILSGLTSFFDLGFLPSYDRNSNIKNISNNNISFLVLNDSYNASYGGCIEFDGTDVSITCNNLPINTTSTQGNTFEFWIEKPTDTNRYTIFSTFIFDLNLIFSGNTLGIYSDENGTSFYGVSISSFSDMLHCVCYLPNDWSTNYSNCKIWINGNEQTISVDTGNYQDVNFISPLPFYIGRGKYLSQNIYFYMGLLSLNRVYSRELTDDEVLYNFNAQKARYGY